MKYSEEEFNSVWKDTSKENILNQFYYEHIELQQALQRIDEVYELVKQYDNTFIERSLAIKLREILKESEENDEN